MKLLFSAVSGLFLLLLLMLSAADVSGQQYPRECVEGVTAWPVTCCAYYNGSQCGSALGRGSCLAAIIYSQTEYKANDERFNFPASAFNYTCQCAPRFMGHNCGECSYGWKGDNCDEKRVNYRVDIMKQTAAFVHAYLAKIHYCNARIDPTYVIPTSPDRTNKTAVRFRDASYLEVMVFIHYHVVKGFLNGTWEVSILNPAHSSTGFIPWHRAFLLLYERQMQRCLLDYDFGLCYYRWQGEKTCTLCTDNGVGAVSPDGTISKFSVFYHWRMICTKDYDNTLCVMENVPCERPRLYRKLSGRFPYKWEVSGCMDKPYIDEFPYRGSLTNSYRYCMEGLHNGVHLFIGGTMAYLAESANDPFFFLHHCNVDMLNNIYMINKNITPDSYPKNNTIYGHEADRCIGPFFECWRNKDFFCPISAHGIVYVD